MSHLDDKTALIRGGGRGIGRAIALQLAERGVRVAVAARSEAELVETTSAIAAAGGRAQAIVADLATPGAGTALARRARDKLDRVDVLINNAAVVAPLGARTGVDVEEFVRVFTLNVTNVAELTFALHWRDLGRRGRHLEPIPEHPGDHYQAQPGDTFPMLTITPAEGRPLELPGALAGHFAVVLLYRGGWCPYCNAQLRAFRRAADRLAEIDVRVVALSVDDEATTRQTIAEHDLEFPVGHDADADAVAAATGAFVNDEPGTCSPPDSFSAPSAGSSSASTPAARSAGSCPDVIGLVKYVREHEAHEQAA